MGLEVLRPSSGAIVALAIQTVLLVAWLVQMHADVERLKAEHASIVQQIGRIDDQGTRAMETVRNRQIDVMAVNDAQNRRLEDLSTKQNEIFNKQVENRYLLEQAIAAMRGAGIFTYVPSERYNAPMPDNKGKR